MPVVSGFHTAIASGLAAAALMLAVPVAAQDDSTATPSATPVPATTEVPVRPRVNLMVTVPRGEVNQAQAKECVDRADAGAISGEIVVCRETGSDTSALTGDRAASQKRYAQETMNKGAPRAAEAFGIADNGKGIGFGGAPPPALMIDVAALPKAPAGSDADRIARGLPPLNENPNLSEEEEKARREAAGIKTVVPSRPSAKKRKGG